MFRTNPICVVAGLAALTVFAAPAFAQQPAVFAHLNGETISQDEYLRALERQQVNASGNGPPVNALRFVLDQMIGNRVILAEAVKENVAPSPEAIDRYFATQKALYEHQFPGKDYLTTLKEQGTTPEEIKADQRAQLAEANLYVKRMGITQADVRDLYDRARNQIGIPERVQMRFIVAAPDSPDFKKAQDLLAAKTDFATIAQQINPPQLQATAGLLGQLTPIPTITPQYRDQVQNGAEGTVLGPVDFQPAANNQPALKAWIKIEKKLPAFLLPYEEAAILVCRQLIQQRLQQPQNAKFRTALIDLKLKAQFEPTDPRYTVAWEALKRDAQAALATAPGK